MTVIGSWDDCGQNLRNGKLQKAGPGVPEIPLALRQYFFKKSGSFSYWILNFTYICNPCRGSDPETAL